ncbi:hypothetical protein GUITHDRAFT_107048 [Guillardia theta CCMP2712]|uniref:N-acetyltransferase domain-containing protein n=1 Tax=Guillardia theta (strain CCMP2712) TaxID=905079 RepID=L1JFN1_GUITC|nr:hypothetical protein GUITHDRAFT_107048 [Guillardia theta CCMP2712]EKX47137.1 hypothetical protein GUITHDRAFT_107048 [Guillardia theta CCMP2712]|mmetsp:Transcript_49826/g.155935  ORF Transcript_49826/g.155935 Transcript_49826/m.155935 type:complete len:408 (-) Transcript_49826:117-1340(-)|eukprot:XP_005834117.1 hypothetical protein GUITHDRAFT_107048 [Guillardia theta CCMP2712]
MAVHIRKYNDHDDAAVKELSEKTVMGSSMASIIRKLINVFPRYSGTYRHRASEFRRNEIFVAEIERQLVGVVNLGIKDVYLKGKLAKIGYVFGLRVSEKHQGRGIGMKLMQEVEFAGKAAGCSHLILTTNRDNKNARRLFEDNLGYSCMSDRYISFSPLHAVKDESCTPVQLITSREEASRVHQQFHVGRDFSPVDEQEIVTSEAFLGALYTRREQDKSEACAFLWDASLSKKLIFAGHLPSFFSRPTSYPGVLLVCLGVAGICVAHLSSLFLQKRMGLLLGEVVFAATCAYFWRKLNNLISFVAQREMKTVRIFGHAGRGPNSGTLLKSIFDEAKVRSRREFKAAVVVYNTDTLDPVLDDLFSPTNVLGMPKRKRSFTLFLQKKLSDDEDNLPPHHPNMYFDPRYI